MNRSDLNLSSQTAWQPRTRVFSVASANRSLVLLRRIFADVIGGYARLRELQESLETRRGEPASEESLRDHQARAGEKIRACMAELDELGVVVTDVQTGLVDFPSVMDGRKVYLCWRYGEPAVIWWHEVNETCLACRKLISPPMVPAESS